MLRRSANDTSSLVGHLYDRFGASLYRYALMLLADPSAAEDVIQQVFAALLKPGVASSIESEANYLRRAVRNECYMTLRRGKRRREDAAASPLLEAASGEASADQRLVVERALRDLPPEQREVVHLHVFEGMTFQEIAGATAESINTVASRYRYALARMRQLLEPEH
jgi:RNA polymerase sigma-70 factor (ECF subfamily)